MAGYPAGSGWPPTRPLLLVRDDDELGAVMRDGRPALTLSVVDIPPTERAPSLGRVRIDGRAHRLTGGEAGAAVQEFAEHNPIAELFDVGRGASMWLVDVDQVRLDRYGFIVDIGGPERPDSDGWVRLSFPRPVHCRHDLAHVLHPVLFPTCPDPSME